MPAPGDLIVLVGPVRLSPQWMGIVGGARRFMEKYPTLRLKTTAPMDDSAEALSRIVAAVLTDKPRAILLYVNDPVVARPAIDAILARPTILVTMGPDPDIPGAFGHVYVNLPGGADLLAENLTEVAAGRQSYLLLHSNGETPVATHCYERFMQEARAQFKMTLLEEQDTDGAEQSPAELIRAMLARFRHAGLVVTLDPGPWLSGRPAELLGNEARFATLGAVPPLWPYLLSGEAAALVGPLDGEIGWQAAELAIVGMTEQQKPGLVRVVDTHLVTRATLHEFATRYAEAGGFKLAELLPGATTTQPAAAPPSEARP